MNQSKVASSFAFKFLERLSVKAIGLVISIVLARLLEPETFGLLALIAIFVNLANTFVQSGFGTALVQNQSTKEDDYSTVFFLVFGIASFFTVLLFLVAPFVAQYYNNDMLIWPLRVLSFSLPFGALNSIQTAKLQREMRFKTLMRCNLMAAIISGTIGVVAAYRGAGLWALVMYNLSQIISVSVCMLFVAKWHPKWIFSLERAKVFFSFGWKMLVSGLLCSLYYDIRALIIGRRYSTADLAYYSKGQQYPDLIEKTINESIQSVMLPVMSRAQDSKEVLNATLLRTISTSMFGVIPTMLGLASVSETLIPLLLTEKWTTCIPLLCIFCLGNMVGPIQSSNLSILKAKGRSDLYMKVEWIRRIVMIITLFITVFAFDSVMVIALGYALGFWLDAYIIVMAVKKLTGIGWLKQLLHTWKSFLAGAIMAVVVYFLGRLEIHALVKLIVQMGVGALIYVLTSILLKNEVLLTGKDIIFNFFKNRYSKNEKKKGEERM